MEPWVKPEWPKIEVTAPIEYPAVYKPDTRWTPQGRYAVSLAARYVPVEVRATLLRGLVKARLTATSRRAPIVEEVNGDYAELDRLYREADIRNISRDRLLSGAVAKLTLQIVTVSLRAVNQGDPFNFLGLVKVTVHADEIRSSLERACAAYWY